MDTTGKMMPSHLVNCSVLPSSRTTIHLTWLELFSKGILGKPQPAPLSHSDPIYMVSLAPIEVIYGVDIQQNDAQQND
jgi:hypothetical protein